MNLSIRWKLMASYLLVLILVGGILTWYLNNTLEDQLLSNIKENLQQEAQVAALLAEGIGPELSQKAPDLAKEIGKRIKARVTVIGVDGQVIGDSEVSPDRLKDLENHLDRPEVREAAKSGIGSMSRYSVTLSSDMLYVAMVVKDDQSLIGFVRLALPLADLHKAMKSLHSILAAALGLAGLLSLALSFLLSSVLSKTLREMAAIAQKIGQGKFDQRLPVVAQDELGWLAKVMNEVTVRLKNQMNTLIEDKRQLDAVLNGMGEGLMVTDAQGRINLVNPAFRLLFSLPEEVIGRPIIDFIRHPGLNQALQDTITSRTERSMEIVMEGTVEKTFLAHWTPLQDAGVLKGVVAVFLDISPIKRLETIRRDFVANASHELKTPITVISGYAETLLEGVLETDPESTRKFVTIIHDHAKRLATLVRDLLTLSELESPNLSLDMSPIDFDTVVKRVRGLFEAKAQEKDITLARTELTNAPRVLADPRWLEQVLINLLDNAIRYSPTGGLVSIETLQLETMIQVRVSDQGPGIPSRALSRIFERFYRADPSRSKEEGGTGLGLAIVKHIIQLHGGTISVQSTPGKGAAFAFTLRVA